MRGLSIGLAGIGEYDRGDDDALATKLKRCKATAALRETADFLHEL